MRTQQNQLKEELSRVDELLAPDVWDVEQASGILKDILEVHSQIAIPDRDLLEKLNKAFEEVEFGSPDLMQFRVQVVSDYIDQKEREG